MVPVVSKNVTNNNEKIINTTVGILLNSSPNPDKNPPNTLKFKLNDTHCVGIDGKSVSGDVNPTNENI